MQAETNCPEISCILSLRNTHHHLTEECPSWPFPLMVNKLWNCSFSMYTWHCHHFPASALIKGNSRQRTTEITEATEAVLSYKLQTPLPFAAKPKKKNLCLCSWFWSQFFNRVNLTKFSTISSGGRWWQRVVRALTDRILRLINLKHNDAPALKSSKFILWAIVPSGERKIHRLAAPLYKAHGSKPKKRVVAYSPENTVLSG